MHPTKCMLLHTLEHILFIESRSVVFYEYYTLVFIFDIIFFVVKSFMLDLV